jgi:hypothetical protein
MSSNLQMLECDVTLEDKMAVESFRKMLRLPSNAAAARLLIRMALGLRDNEEIWGAEPNDGASDPR